MNAATPVRVGFIPLTDCAPLVVAATHGFDRRHGIELRLSREPSWATLRDRLLVGAIDAAHLLHGLAYGIELGIAGPRADMAVLMTLNRNGQAITLARHWVQQGVVDGPSLARAIARSARPLVFAHTFPTGTHAMWLQYWLAAHGIHPHVDVRMLTVPPQQMVARLASGAIDGYSAGEPWNARAVRDGIGCTLATSQSIWPDHPEKVLACRREFVSGQPALARALAAAVLDAARWLEQQADLDELARVLAQDRFVGCDAVDIADRLKARYVDGCGRRWDDAHGLRFFDGGRVPFPYLSDGMWFMTQQRRWGLLREDPDYVGVASAVSQIALYREVAAMLGVACPESPCRSSVLVDGRAWDGSEPAAYAASFAIAHAAPAAVPA